MQEARARAPHAPTALLGRMTSAFALGQILGPLAAAALSWLRIDAAAALDVALWIAALGLVASAAVLRRLAACAPHPS
jgi:hypothetical protein